MQPTLEYGLGFPVGRGCVRLFAFGPGPVGEFLQLPPIGEWTRIEMTHAVDEETGRYFISVSFAAGIEVMKVMRQLDPKTLVMDATIGCGDPHHAMSGGIRGLVVLEKS